MTQDGDGAVEDTEIERQLAEGYIANLLEQLKTGKAFVT